MAESVDDFIAGYVSGIAGLVIGSPLDILKVRLQASSSASVRPAENFPRATTLFTGLLPPLLGLGFLNAILFTSYSATAQSILQVTDRFPLSTAWSAGAVAGMACWIVSAPTELVKCRAQLLPRSHPPSSYHIMRDIYRAHGLRGLYFGGLITSVRDSIGYGFYFWGYEGAKLLLLDAADSDGVRMGKMLSAGGIAGCITWASVYPLDTVKTRYQTQYMSSLEEMKPLIAGERRYASTWHCIKDTFRQEGVAGMYRGMGITMVRAFIVNAVTFYGYEWMKEWLDR